MDNASLAVGFKFTPECQHISWRNPGDTWRKINIMSDEKGLGRAGFHNETLMPTSLHIIRQNSANNRGS
jgi:hypothetical protein